MISNNNQTISHSGNELVVERIFNAPRTLVFEALSKAEHLQNWWSPDGWTVPICEVDFRVGGTWFYCMEGEDGTRGCGKATYLEIVEPEKIVFRDAFADEEGNPLEGMPVSTSTYHMTEADGKTTLRTVTHYESAEALQQVLDMGMIDGLTLALNKLDNLLASLQ